MAPCTATAAISPIVSAFASKVAGMTSGTVRCVLRYGVHKRHCDDTAMTCTTAWVASMVTRVVPIRIMTESGRRPSASDMACITLQIRG